MKTFTVFVAKIGETWMPNWKPVGHVKARGVKAAAQKYLVKPRPLATHRFTDGHHDYIFSPL